MAIDESIKRVVDYHKNVYEGYQSNIAKRSDPEKKMKNGAKKTKR